MVSFVSFITQLTSPEFWIHNPWFVLMAIFQIWMLVDAIRRQEYFWAVIIFIGSGLAAILYYFFVFRQNVSMQGFELPGAGTRARIKELEAQIHHLDKAHHHYQLGDIYFGKGKFTKAEACYRAALEREPEDIDARAHLGQALLRQKRAAEAKPILHAVCSENPRHDYGYSLMAYAETLMALGEADAAICAFKQVLEKNSYARARVQLAELYLQRGEQGAARTEVREVLADDLHAPRFQRKRDRYWVKRAKALSRKTGS